MVLRRIDRGALAPTGRGPDLQRTQRRETGVLEPACERRCLGMKKLLIGLAGLVGLAFVAVFVVPFLLPTSFYEARIEAAATEAVGRSVTIEGAPRISFVPAQAVVSGLTVANADGFSEPHFLKVDTARIGVKLRPLLQGRIEMTTFTLDAPDIRLQSKSDGAANWIFTPKVDPDSPGTLPDIRLGTVRLNDARLQFDNGTGRIWRATDGDLVIEAPSLDQPLKLAGALEVEAVPGTIDLTLTTPRRLAETDAAEIALKLKVGDNAAAATLQLAEGLQFGGDVDVDFPALRSLVALMGAELGTDKGFQRLRLTGPIDGSMTHIAFSEGTTLAFDEITGTGNMRLDLKDGRAKVSGQLAAGTVDLRPYLPAEPAPTAAQKAEKGAAFPAWSEEKIDLSALGALDADLALSAQRILLPSLELGESAVRLNVDAGNVLANIERASLYGGTGKGKIVVSTRARNPAMAIDFEMDTLNVGAFGQALLGIHRLQGAGDVSIIRISTRGQSQADFVRNLSGALVVRLDQGTIEGINIGKIARSALITYDEVKKGGLNTPTLLAAFNGVVAESQGPDQQTDFSVLNVGVEIVNGIANTREVRLTGPYFDVLGVASIDLPAQTMRMTLTPSVSTADGQPLRTLPVPVLVSGSFNAPRVGVDTEPLLRGVVQDRLSGILKDQGIDVPAGSTVQDALKVRARDEVGGLVRDRLNKARGTTPATTPPADPQAPEAEDPPADEKAPADPAESLLETGLGAIFGGKDE